MLKHKKPLILQMLKDFMYSTKSMLLSTIPKSPVKTDSQTPLPMSGLAMHNNILSR